jgi:hypothetical protein
MTWYFGRIELSSRPIYICESGEGIQLHDHIY